MIKSRGIWIGDVHFKDNPVSCRVDYYMDTIEEKLNEIFNIAIEKQVDYIGFLGDLIDRPDPSGEVRNRLLRILLSQKEIPMYTVVGNHDIFGANIKTIGKTALETMGLSNAINIVDEEPDFGLFFGHYKSGIEKEVFQSDMPLWAIHAYILPDKSSIFSHCTIDDFQTTAKIVITGHYHSGYPIMTRDDGVMFVCPGSIGRITVNDIDHDIVVAYVEMGDGVNVEYIPVPNVKPSSVVFDLSSRENITKAQEVDISNFIDNINDAQDAIGVSIDGINLMKMAAKKWDVEDIVVQEAEKRISNAHNESKKK